MDCITVTLCAGTACTVMDGSQLAQLEEHLPEHLKGRVKVRGARCLDLCNEDRASEGPYVLVGGEVLSRASIPAIIATLEARLSQEA